MVGPEQDLAYADPVFESHRPSMISAAAHTLGQVQDVEDVLQEAWIRWRNANQTDIDNPAAFLITVVTRLSLDRLRRLRARREAFTGGWQRELPDPNGSPDPSQRITRHEEVAEALLHALHTLPPTETAAFLLREVFDLSYAEVAAALSRSEDAVRQFVHRARRHLRSEVPRYVVAPTFHHQAVETFLYACHTENTAELMQHVRQDLRIRRQAAADAGR